MIWGTLVFISLTVAGLSLEVSAQIAPESGNVPKAQGQSSLAVKLPDLDVHYLGLNPAGVVVYQVVNKGSAGTEKPFAVDIYLNGVIRDTIRHEPLPAMTLQGVQSNLARFSECQEGMVRLVIDAQNSVRESNRKNNERSAKLSAACPKAP